jgi:hypothetical protein
MKRDNLSLEVAGVDGGQAGRAGKVAGVGGYVDLVSQLGY